MYRIEVDRSANMISLQLSGVFDAKQGEELVSSFTQELNNLNPGFKLLTDLSKLESMDLEAYKSIDQIMDLSNKKKVSQVVRVLTNKNLDIGFNIMSLFHYSRHVEIQTCSTLAEARKYLIKKNAGRE